MQHFILSTLFWKNKIKTISDKWKQRLIKYEWTQLVFRRSYSWAQLVNRHTQLNKHLDFVTPECTLKTRSRRAAFLLWSLDFMHLFLIFMCIFCWEIMHRPVYLMSVFSWLEKKTHTERQDVRSYNWDPNIETL